MQQILILQGFNFHLFKTLIKIFRVKLWNFDNILTFYQFIKLKLNIFKLFPANVPIKRPFISHKTFMKVLVIFFF